MVARRKDDICQVLEVMLCNDSSSEDLTSSESEDDLELLLLDAMLTPKRELGPRVNFHDIDEFECERWFRFKKRDIERLYLALNIPDRYICSQGTSASGLEALLVMLRRFAYPNRWCDLVPMFSRSEQELSGILAQITNDIYNRYSHLLSSLELSWLDPALFSEAIYNKGAPLRNCWGFIDGTARPIPRPIHSQRIMYSGHKRTHCIKFQSIQAPNGLIAHMFGPIEGRRHDAFMLGESGVGDKLRQIRKPSGEPYVVYGDPAYGLGNNILAPFRGAQLTAQEKRFNKAMSKVRISVEWGFGKICQYFAFLDFKKNLKVLLQPVAKYYIIASLLSNCHTCLYGSVTGKYFNIDPPTLEEYLANS